MSCESCENPSKSSYCTISNKTANCVLSIWIIYNYICWAFSVLALIGIPMFISINPSSDTTNNIELISSMISIVIGTAIQQLIISFVLNIYERIKRLENKMELGESDALLVNEVI